MPNLTYEPIEDDFYRAQIIEDDLYHLYRKLQALFENGQLPEKIIQIKEKR